MKNAVPKNASYFAVQAILDIYRTQKENSTTNRALRSMMTLFSIESKKFVKAHRLQLLEVQSVEEFEEFVQSLARSLSSKTINFNDDVDFKEITVCDTTPTLLKATFLLSHAAKSGVDKTVIGLTLRDITFHIRPILVSKKMLSQLTQYKNNEIDTFKNGTVEHATPMNIIRDRIIKAETVAELKSVLEIDLVLVYVTKEEDARLDKKGFGHNVPVNGTWEDRYRLCGIEIHEEEVEFPIKDFVPSVTIPFPPKFKGKTEIPSIFSSINFSELFFGVPKSFVSSIYI